MVIKGRTYNNNIRKEKGLVTYIYNKIPHYEKTN